MTIQNSDISGNYIIQSFKNSISKGDVKTISTTTSAGGKKVTIAATFGSINFPNGDILRISDGTTTINFDSHANALNTANTIAHTDDASTAVDQFVSKINASALNITATDNGGTSSNASFTLIPGSGATVTVTEDPTGNGQFGTSASHCVIEDVSGTNITKESKFGPFRLAPSGPFNIREQNTTNPYRTFIGKQKI